MRRYRAWMNQSRSSDAASGPAHGQKKAEQRGFRSQAFFKVSDESAALCHEQGVTGSSLCLSLFLGRKF